MTLQRKIALAASVFTVCAAQGATVISFDDIAFPGGNPTASAHPPAGYQGLDWGAAWTVSPNDATGWYGGTKQPYAHSANNFAWNSGGNSYELRVAGGGTFDVTSLWARTWPPGTASFTVQGSRNGSVVYTQQFSVNDTYALVTLNFVGIDLFSTAAAQQFLLDDLTVDRISPVPEPAPAALLLAGIGGLGMAMRRRHHALRTPS